MYPKPSQSLKIRLWDVHLEATFPWLQKRNHPKEISIAQSVFIQKNYIAKD